MYANPEWLLDRVGQLLVLSWHVSLSEIALRRGRDVREHLHNVLWGVLVRQDFWVVHRLFLQALQCILVRITALELAQALTTQEGGGCRSAAADLAGKEREELVNLRPGLEVLGKQVCRVDLASDLPELEVVLAEALLDPQRVAFDVSQLS